MVGKQRLSFDPETVSLLRKTLDDTWERLRPEQQAMTLAERILKSAAKGERNPERLRDAALTAPCFPAKAERPRSRPLILLALSSSSTA
jgi:hypothetical protein